MGVGIFDAFELATKLRRDVRPLPTRLILSVTRALQIPDID
jgi:hypothetical protein